MEINETLQERGGRYGVFAEQAVIAQSIKRAMVNSKNWQSLDDDMLEGLDMVANKIARILNGDPNYADSWHDIVGYVKLIEDRLNGLSR